jgi:sulfur-oxidizing protein SoxY
MTRTRQATAQNCASAQGFSQAKPCAAQAIRLLHQGRRRLLKASAAMTACGLAPGLSASTMGMELAINQFTGGRPSNTGRVLLDMPALVENGNSVPVRIEVSSPMTERDHVLRIALFSEKNPLPQVAVFHLGTRAGRAAVTTRMRLADSQKVVAVAEMSDGSFQRAQADVIVTLAACIET